MKTLNNLLLDQLAKMYLGEQQIAGALSRLMKLASNDELRVALKVHAYETVGHISKVAQLFTCFGEHTAGMQGSAISELLAEANALVSLHEKSPASDGAIISVALKLEHYEITTYGCLRDWARMLNNEGAVVILEEILGEETAICRKLTGLAHVIEVDAPGETDHYVELESGIEAATAHQERRHGWRHHGFSRGHLLRPGKKEMKFYEN